MASYEQVVKFENEKPQGVLRLVESNGLFALFIPMLQIGRFID